MAYAGSSPGLSDFFPLALRRSKSISDALTVGWLELFQRRAKAVER
jgi:hypothetical protein